MNLSKKISQLQQAPWLQPALYTAVALGILIPLFDRIFIATPHSLHFFLTCDAFEHFVFAIIAYAAFFKFRSWTSFYKIIFIVTSLSCITAMAGLKDYDRHGQLKIGTSFDIFTSYLGIILLLYFTFNFIHNLPYLNRYRQMQLELNKTKEQLLKNKLHPHFLFNAFNSLYSLSLQNKQQTSTYILKLSNMMRYLTDESALSVVPLAREVAFIQDYITIEQIRFGTDDRIQFHHHGVAMDFLVPPLLLIPLVENAFKHGLYTNQADSYIRINISQLQNNVIFSIVNKKQSKQHFQESRQGKGLDILRERLQLSGYPKNALHIKETEEEYLVQLTLTPSKL